MVNKSKTLSAKKMMMMMMIVIMSYLRGLKKDRTKPWGKNGIRGGRELIGVCVPKTFIRGLQDAIFRL